MMKKSYIPSFLFILFLFNIPPLIGNTGGISGSNLFQVTSDGTSTTFKIVSASLTGEPIFTGSVDSVVSDTNITFSTSIDENNETVYPFFASGSFNKDVQVPRITSPTISSGSVPNTFSSSNIDYGGGFDSNLVGFTNAPEVVISPSDGGGESASATATLGTGLNSGKITSISVTDGGTSYSATPSVSIVGGPHFVRIIDSESSYFGRVFLIENNSQTSLKLDLSSAAVYGETQAASTFFSSGTLVEICPAATLSSIFGSGSNLLSGMSSASSWNSPDGADWIYLYSPGSGYIKYFHVDYTGHRFLSSKTGWYSQGSDTLSNNAVIYPDEAFIIAKRKSGTIELDVEVAQLDAPARIYLPESGDIFVANNPYGMDMLLTELIPSTAIGTGTNQFKPGASDSDPGMDTITILNDSGWNTYYYKVGSNDGGITDLMVAEARAGTGGSNALQASDLSISSGTITALTSWENSNSAGSVTGNDGNYTFIETSSPPSAGFKVTISGLEGFLLNSDGTSEMNATTEEDVADDQNGSLVLSALNGTHEVVFANGSGFVVEKQMDVNHTDDAAHSSLPNGSWNIGDLGTGYNGAAYWWAVGGNNGTTDSNASGTVTTGGSFTVTAAGSGYTSAPQIVVSGGGWRNLTDSSSPQGGQVIGSDDGIIIHRKHSTGVSAFIELPNITD